MGIPEATLPFTCAGSAVASAAPDERLHVEWLVAKQVSVPVKLLWRARTTFLTTHTGPNAWVEAGLDAQASWWPGPAPDHLRRRQADCLGRGIGGDEFPSGYTPNYGLFMTAMPLILRCGPLRAPGGNAYAWVGQSFLDELAVRLDAIRWSFNWRFLSNTPVTLGQEPRRRAGDLNPERLAEC